jgi:sporulation protein YabP
MHENLCNFGHEMKGLLIYLRESISGGLFFMEEKQGIQKLHKVSLNARNQAMITGVKDVLSFDAGEVLLDTEQGILMIRGNELHVNRLTLEKGEVDVDGRIDSLTYSDSNGYGKSGESFITRLFK